MNAWYRKLLYGSGDPSVGGSGEAPDGSLPEVYRLKYVGDLARTLAYYHAERRRDSFRLAVEAKKREVEFAKAWQDYHARITDTAGEVTREAIKAKVDALKAVLDTLYRWRGSNDQRVGAFVIEATARYHAGAGETPETVVYDTFRRLSDNGVGPGDTSLPNALDDLKRRLWGASALDERGRIRSFRDLWSDTPGQDHMLHLALQWEEAAEATKSRTIEVDDQIRKLNEITQGATQRLVQGQLTEASGVLATSADIIRSLPKDIQPPTLATAEAGLRAAQAEDPTSTRLDALFDLVTEDLEDQTGKKKTVRELVGRLIATPQFQTWAAGHDFVLGDAKVETVDGKTRLAHYVEGPHDTRAVLRYLWETNHDPNRRLQLYGSGKLAKVIVDQPDESLRLQYRLATQGPLASMYAQATDDTDSAPYLTAAQVGDIARAHGVFFPADVGAPEVFVGRAPSGAAVLRVVNGDSVRYFSLGKDRKVAYAPDDAEAVTSWLPIYQKGEAGASFLSSVDVRLGDTLNNVSVMADDAARKEVYGDPAALQKALLAEGVRLTDVAPRTRVAVVGELIPRDARDPDGVVRVSSRDGYFVLGKGPEKVVQVDVLANRPKVGLLSVQSRTRGAVGTALGQAAERRNLPSYGPGVPVNDLRARAPREGQPPGPVGRGLDALVSAFMTEPRPDSEPVEQDLQVPEKEDGVEQAPPAPAPATPSAAPSSAPMPAPAPATPSAAPSPAPVRAPARTRPAYGARLAEGSEDAEEEIAPVSMSPRELRSQMEDPSKLSKPRDAAIKRIRQVLQEVGDSRESERTPMLPAFRAPTAAEDEPPAPAVVKPPTTAGEIVPGTADRRNAMHDFRERYLAAIERQRVLRALGQPGPAEDQR